MWVIVCLVAGQLQPSHFTSEQASKSVPNFERCALEIDIGRELRDVSDSFYLEFSGFVSHLRLVDTPYMLPSFLLVALLLVSQ